MGHALDGLAGYATAAGDLGHGRGLVCDGIQDDPAGQRLVGQASQGFAGGGEQATQPGDFENELGEGLTSWGAGRPS